MEEHCILAEENNVSNIAGRNQKLQYTVMP
jgi:hypothetical protein